MISLKLQIILLVVALLFSIQIIKMITRYKLDLKYALLWLLMGVSFVVIAIYPGIIYKISNLLSIKTPTNALFLLGIFSILSILFSLTIALSRASNKIKDLSQELGILKHEFEVSQKQVKRE